MLETKFHIPWGMGGLLLVAGFGLLVVFWLLRYYVLPLVRRRQAHRKFTRWLNIVQPLLWVAYLLWALVVFLHSNFLITLVIMAATILVGLDYWRNVFYGFILRMEDRLHPGLNIQTKTFTGKLLAIRFAHSEIQTQEGGILQIPNQDLRSALFQATQDDREQNIQHIPLSFLDRKSPIDTRQLIQLAQQCPWIIADNSIEIEDKGEGNFELKARLVNQDASSKVQAFFGKMVTE